MLVELGNHASVQPGIDDRPKVTTVHFPEFDETGLGGYTHKPGLTVEEFKSHMSDAAAFNDGITRLPDHEILVSLLHYGNGSWGTQGRGRPEWVRVVSHEELHGKVKVKADENGEKPIVIKPHSQATCDDLENFLSSYFEVPSAEDYFKATDPTELMVKRELAYWSRTAPGVLPPGLALPNMEMTYTNNGRVISNINDGGGQVGYTNAATASSATTLTQTGAAWTTNQWAGYRVYAQSSTSNMVWANVVSNTGTVLTVDRWYAAATPGGTAGTTPTATSPFLIADGGSVSAWFVGLATGANAAAATDTTLSTNGNAEITTAGGGLIRKIAPYAQTSGVASRSYTLTPVYTANGSDSLPAVVTTMGAFVSMVVGTVGTMKWETVLNASATLNLSGDQLTVTQTVTGS